ncbi:MAG: hypothetical protein CMG04_00125 [Candidatus Marinimicrobia bacterium]|nr:hypothetical protein [Candidatus Neomarinimicrobiota bacterium]|tara:strand:+ start:1000 stop:2232 length:1233 start_codon:yes stop_codon:yes gene_type:complete
MNENKRRLAAVMFTDIVGYSKLMNSDESKAMKLLNEHDKISEKCILKFNGRLIKKIGDANFVEFSSSLNAVKCSIYFQEILKERNKDLDLTDKIEMRIGIHVGDIIEKDDDIFGDGVNIASRIVSIAKSGEICISKEANASIQGQKHIRSASIGPHNLKNIVESWDVFRVFINDEEYSTWAEENYTKQKSFKQKASKLKKYLYFFIFILLLIVNIPLIGNAYSEYHKKKSIIQFSNQLELILSSTRLLNSLMYIKTNKKSIYLSIRQDFLFPIGRGNELKMEYDLDSNRVVRKDITNALTPIIEMINKFDGNIEIIANSDSDPMPRKWQKRYKTNAHLSGARSASVFQYFIDNGLDIQNIRIKNLLWGPHKPYEYIDSKKLLTREKILNSNSTKEKKTMNRRVDIHFYYN